MTRVLIVGMNPAMVSYRKSGSMRRLERWADELGLRHFSFVNVGSDPGVPRPDWTFVKRCCEGYDRVVALGNFASGALQKLGINHFKLPHPSGRNRLLNDPEFEREVLSSCHRYLHGKEHDDPLSLLAPRRDPH